MFWFRITEVVRLYEQSLNIGVCGLIVTLVTPMIRGVYESYLIIMGRLILKIFKMDHPFTIYNHIDKKNNNCGYFIDRSCFIVKSIKKSHFQLCLFLRPMQAILTDNTPCLVSSIDPDKFVPYLTFLYYSTDLKIDILGLPQLCLPSIFSFKVFVLEDYRALRNFCPSPSVRPTRHLSFCNHNKIIAKKTLKLKFIAILTSQDCETL